MGHKHQFLPTNTNISSTTTTNKMMQQARIAPVAAVSSGKRHYHEKVLDHYNRPRNVGSMSQKDVDVGTGLVGAPACGDVMKLQIRVDPETNKISEVKNTEIAKELCLPPVKLHCSMLAEDAIKSAITNYYSKNPNARSTDLGGTGSSMPKIDVETVMQPAASQTATV